jgi:hypothetical protein
MHLFSVLGLHCAVRRLANHTAYVYACEVTAKDTYEGLQKASDLFVAGTLAR